MKYKIKNIPNFPGYKLDTNCDVWSCWQRKPIHKKGKYGGVGMKAVMSDEWKKLKIFKRGRYHIINFRKDGKSFNKLIHRLMLEIFVGPCPKGMEACHNNGDRTDNRLENLRWDTRKNNHADAIRHGTHQGLKNRGENHNWAKLTKNDVELIWELLHHSNMSQVKIGKLFNVQNSLICRIKSRKIWRTLDLKVPIL